jgi:hypothetical protein
MWKSKERSQQYFWLIMKTLKTATLPLEVDYGEFFAFKP